MNHHLIVIDISEPDPLKVKCVLPSPSQLQQMDDTEDFIIIDPLTNQVYIKGEWQAIPASKLVEFNGMFNLE